MNGREKLTIAIPTFNRGEILKKCLNDLLKLNRSVVEILVVDNHSTDSTEKVCTELLEKQQISSVVTPNFSLNYRILFVARGSLVSSCAYAT